MTCRRRRGSVYILVLGITTLVATIGIGAALTSRTALERQNEAGTLLEADAAARSAIELALATLNNAPSKITSLPANELGLPTTIAGYVVAVSISDPDEGTVGNDPYERLSLVAMAERGSVRQYRSIIIEPTIGAVAGQPLYHIMPGTYQIRIE